MKDKKGHALTLNVFATDVIAILGSEPARLHVLQVGGHSSLSKGRDTYRRAGPCAGCAHAHRGAGWAWRDMQMAVSCSWGFGRPGIGYDALSN